MAVFSVIAAIYVMAGSLVRKIHFLFPSGSILWPSSQLKKLRNATILELVYVETKLHGDATKTAIGIFIF